MSCIWGTVIPFATNFSFITNINNTPEAAERDMIVTGEPESLEYIVIKGIQLDTEEGIASFPTNIKE
jgi:hypothetical protein